MTESLLLTKNLKKIDIKKKFRITLNARGKFL
jgi:hypothetical protein